ncbi:MAG: TolC family protein [Paraglaciecola sp.]|uniref:TolC family protein n=2 Tax=Paraglaciecola sp. TaxID=1920173 RepID=UPI00326774CF
MALQATLKNHPALKGQQAQLTASEYSIDSAKAARYPSMSFITNNLDKNYNQGTLQVNQPLWTFGRINSSIDLAKANYNAEERALLQVKRSLLEATATTYANVQGAQFKTEIAKENLTEHQRLYDRIKRRATGQLASTADVNLAYSRLLQAQSELHNHKGSLAVSLNELYALTQVTVTTATPISPSDLQLPSVNDIKQLAILQSADVAYSKEQVHVAKLQKSNEKKSIMPTISLRLERDLLQTSPYTNVDKTRVGIVVEGSLEGMGVSTYNRLKGATAGIQAAQFQLDSAVNEIKRKVDNLLINKELQSQLRTAQINSVSALEKTMSSFLRQYETNRKSWVEVLNTQREMTQARYVLIDIDSQWNDISLQLATLIGHLDALANTDNL